MLDSDGDRINVDPERVEQGLARLVLTVKEPVASIDTYLMYSEAVGIAAPVSRPRELGAGDEWNECGAKR